jgi:hypothetical protein
MAKSLLTTPFPSTTEVARKLGLPNSRVRRVAALMGFSAPEAAVGKLRRARKQSPKYGVKSAQLNRKNR